ncbi:DEAD/DEAH box helicase [Inquilinus sp. CA228]|uniref:DEAD/DEAH box helicase n=1 Tax=Inquilinus sp. CA228 TaxID=3455609 RepID=UPI003F8D6950
MPEARTESILDVLAYWHRIEFFIPFDLKQVTEKAGVIRLLADGLGDKTPDDLWTLPVEDGKEITRFHLYLGVFSKTEIDRVSRRLRPAAAGSGEAIEDAERGDIEGDTCFAKLSLTPQGAPDLGSVSVSTVPWAIGRVDSAELEALTDQDRADAFVDLEHRLHNAVARRLPAGVDGMEMPLSGSDLHSIIALLQDWAGFAPRNQLAAVLQPVIREKKDRPLSPARPAEAQEHDEAPPEADEDDGSAEADTGIDILNSFFILDLERAMAAVRQGEVPAALAAYLDSAPAPGRTDLYSEAGRRAILDMVHPRRLPPGRWLRAPGQAMSLMQQFAINCALDRLGTDGMYSVNGPPGTGKTTLLSDIFAEIIVRRARALAGFDRASDTIVERHIRVAFAPPCKEASIGRLAAEIIGHEMVVASSNNAAVENISKDLPKRGALGEDWRDSFYLRSVAHKVATQQGNGTFKQPGDDRDVSWGLIACALGKSANRRAFAERAFFKVEQKGRRQAPEDPVSTLYEWIDAYDGPSFAAAAQAFREADRALAAEIDALAADADLVAEMLSPDTALADATTEAEAAEAKVRSVEAELAQGQSDLAQCRQRLDDLAEEERLIDRWAPGPLARLLRRPDTRAYRDRRRANAADQLSHRTRRGVLEARAEALRSALSSAAAALDTARSARDAAQEERSRKQTRLSALPESHRLSALSDLEESGIQKAGLWHDDRLAASRSALFKAALALHEAWLAEVGRKGRGLFRGNLVAISNMLKGFRPAGDADARLIWQSLFLIVPIVSSTFASFARQFRDLGPGDIGWLFIDEAGQATPQAAVGALWRARRAVVVGDPLQIEPVFTVPTRLIEALSDDAATTRDGRYAPNRVSAQQLADRTNPFGALVPAGDQGDIWIGSPLRVHRRCAGTMFKIANTIAYDGKMIFATNPPGPGKSGWVDVAGAVRGGRQAVPEQVEIVFQAVLRLYRHGAGELPPLYVISPFRSVKEALTAQLTDADRWAAQLDPLGLAAPKRRALHEWSRDRIGTVHTFQGREQRLVLMVLGADHDHARGADWASLKPNLLNVSVTRAQRAFYIIGDRSLWGGKPYFRTARDELRGMSPGAFLVDILD